jgi:hypothetical protein
LHQKVIANHIINLCGSVIVRCIAHAFANATRGLAAACNLFLALCEILGEVAAQRFNAGGGFSHSLNPAVRCVVYNAAGAVNIAVKRTFIKIAA